MDPRAAFLTNFSDLIGLIRRDPQNAVAQAEALRGAALAVAKVTITIEAGVLRDYFENDYSVQAALTSRGIEQLVLRSGTPATELLRLAKALATLTEPPPETEHIRVRHLTVLERPLAAPVQERTDDSDGLPFSPSRTGADRRSGAERRRPPKKPYTGPERRRNRTERRSRGERRLDRIKVLSDEVGARMQQLTALLEQKRWRDALEVAHWLARALPRVPADERRSVRLTFRRLLGRNVLQAFADLGLQDEVLQPLVAEVLPVGGREGADILFDALCRLQAIDALEPYQDALVLMPETRDIVLPALRSAHWQEARHAAVLLGRMRDVPNAVQALEGQLDNASDKVRAAVAEALANFPTAHTVPVLRRALENLSPAVRSAAARAVAVRGIRELVGDLAQAVSVEKDAPTWGELVRALGAVEAPEATAALVTIVLAKRGLLSRKGYPLEQRLLALEALGRSRARGVATALRRLARDGDPPVRDEAQRILAADGRGD